MITLDVPLITWCAIAFAIAALIVTRICLRVCNAPKRHVRLFEIGSEREEFFVPGDRIIRNEEDIYDDEE